MVKKSLLVKNMVNSASEQLYKLTVFLRCLEFQLEWFTKLTKWIDRCHCYIVLFASFQLLQHDLCVVHILIFTVGIVFRLLTPLDLVFQLLGVGVAEVCRFFPFDVHSGGLEAADFGNFFLFWRGRFPYGRKIFKVSRLFICYRIFLHATISLFLINVQCFNLVFVEFCVPF